MIDQRDAPDRLALGSEPPAPLDEIRQNFSFELRAHLL